MKSQIYLNILLSPRELFPRPTNFVSEVQPKFKLRSRLKFVQTNMTKRGNLSILNKSYFGLWGVFDCCIIPYSWDKEAILLH